MDRGALHEKPLVQCGPGQKKREQKEKHPQMKDAQEQGLGNMSLSGMADLVGQHRHQFIHRVVFDQGIKQCNPSVFSKPADKGVGFAGTAGTIHFKDFCQRKMDCVGIGQNGLSQCAIRQR